MYFNSNGRWLNSKSKSKANGFTLALGSLAGRPPPHFEDEDAVARGSDLNQGGLVYTVLCTAALFPPVGPHFLGACFRGWLKKGFWVVPQK